MANILEIKNLTKRYTETLAVDNICFSVSEGSCFGLLGPNGAGKTTTIEMMEGILKPTSGEILFEGNPIDKNYYQRVGIQFQNTAIQDFLTVKETLNLFSNFYKQALPIDSLIETCALEEIIDRDTRKLSGGQRQRLLLALAMLNNPKVIFLDEPTTGLDPQSRRNFWQLIDRIKKQNKTVLLTTHYMDEAESLCDEILIIDRGKIIHEGTPRQMLAEHFEGSLLRLPVELEDSLRDSDFQYQKKNQHIEIISSDIDGSIKSLLDKNIPLDGLQVRSPNLEDLFIKLTGHQLRG